MGVPMKWEIARIFVVGTGGSGFCAEAAPSGVIEFFMAVLLIHLLVFCCCCYFAVDCFDV